MLHIMLCAECTDAYGQTSCGMNVCKWNVTCCCKQVVGGMWWIRLNVAACELTHFLIKVFTIHDCVSISFEVLSYNIIQHEMDSPHTHCDLIPSWWCEG